MKDVIERLKATAEHLSINPTKTNWGEDCAENLASDIEAVLNELDKLQERSDRYYELIMCVETKHPNETRHETAVRYIRQRETAMPEAAKEAIVAPETTETGNDCNKD